MAAYPTIPTYGNGHRPQQVYYYQICTHIKFKLLNLHTHLLQIE